MGVFCLVDDEGVIQIPRPDPGWVVLHKWVGHQRAYGGTLGCTMYLFAILTLESEKSTF